MMHTNTDLLAVQQQLRSGGQIPQELIDVFTEEANAHIHAIYDGLDRLHVELNNFDALGDIRRASHTLKGAAGAVGHEAIARLAHCIEELLDRVFGSKQPLTAAQLELILIASDSIHDLAKGEYEFGAMVDSLLKTYQQFACYAETEHSRNTEAPNRAETQQSINGQQTDYTTTVLDQINANSGVSAELQSIFREEAHEILHSIYQSLDRLKLERGDSSALSELRRCSHTLKGAAGAIEMEGITRLAHRMEDMLDVLADRHLPVSDSQLQMMFVTADRIQELSHGGFSNTDMAEAITKLYRQYDQEMQCSHLSADENIQSAHKLVSSEDNANASASVQAIGIRTDAAEPSPIAKPIQRSIGAASSIEGKASESGQYLRVPLERIDSLVALVGEMVVNRSAMNQRLSDFENRIQDMQLAVNRFRAVAQQMEEAFSADTTPIKERVVNGNHNASAFSRYLGGSHPELDSLEFDRYSQLHLLARSVGEATNDISVITNELRTIYGDIDSLIERQQRYNRDTQDGLMHIRMLPISSIVSRLERTVRTVSNKLGKNVELVLVGESIELDKTVLEEITDPLLHLIRNALDHGIETSEERIVQGKSPSAKLTLESLNQGTQVTLRVSDDGRGLDINKVRNKAIEQGLIDEQAELTTDDIQNLIFLPGFSTAANVTDVSGRGVGLDVVRDAVQRLKGTIRVESTPGVGSTFTIHLPTSLSVTRALVVASSSHTFAIPMQSVQQIMRRDMITTTQVGSQTLMSRPNGFLRITDLAQHLEIRTEPIKEDSGSQPVLLIRSGDDEVAITVDSVKGGQDIVVKTLGDHLRHVPGYLGATLTGDGTVIPILDPSELCGEQASEYEIGSSRSADTKTKRRKTAMVIDDSLSVRRVATNLLRTHGWEVIDAKDGLDAIEKLGMQDTPPDVFLCDMEMPRMDGLELIERLRGMPEFAKTPIVMVTSRSSEKHRRLASEAGADEHVVKPFKEDQLIDLIERLVCEHRELACSQI